MMKNRVVPPIYECESLLPPVLQRFSNFGFSLSCNDKLLVVGAPGYKERDVDGYLFIYKTGVPHQLQYKLSVPTFTSVGELVTLSKNGYRIATTCKSHANSHKVVIFRKKEDWEVESVIDIVGKPTSISLSVDSLLLAVGSSNQNTTYVYKLFSTKWKLLTTISNTINDFGRTVLFDNGNLYISGDENVLIYNHKNVNNNTFELLTTFFLKDYKRFGQAIAISPDKKRIATGTPLSSFKGNIESGTIHIFQSDTQILEHTYIYTNLGVGWNINWLDNNKLIISQPNKSYNSMKNVGGLRIVDTLKKQELDIIPNKKQKSMYFGWKLVSNDKFIYVGQPFWDEDTIYSVGRITVFKKREV